MPAHDGAPTGGNCPLAPTAAPQGRDRVVVAPRLHLPRSTPPSCSPRVRRPTCSGGSPPSPEPFSASWHTTDPLSVDTSGVYTDFIQNSRWRRRIVPLPVGPGLAVPCPGRTATEPRESAPPLSARGIARTPDGRHPRRAPDAEFVSREVPPTRGGGRRGLAGAAGGPFSRASSPQRRLTDPGASDARVGVRRDGMDILPRRCALWCATYGARRTVRDAQHVVRG